MTFEELNLTTKTEERELKIADDQVILVKQYLPANDKAKLIEFVAVSAIDDNTATFSPIRVNIYYAMGMIQYYTDLELGDVNYVEAYDALESNGMIDEILSYVPQGERDYMEGLITDTLEDITKYNNSFAGTVRAMSGDAGNLNEAIQNIMNQIRNKEGLELLAEIKNVVGETD